jgi:uridine phosphorylase
MEELQHHIQCKYGDVGRYVFLPGDPARSRMIAEHFDESWKVAENREYVTYTGTVGGHKLSVTSTGIGGPSTAIAVEELARVGADTFIRVGTSGAMQSYMQPGDLVIATGAVRDEGTSQYWIPMEYPAVASLAVTNALVQAALSRNIPYHTGIVHSKALFYGQQHDTRLPPYSDYVTRRFEAWQKGNVLASEMETACIFVLCSTKGLRAGSICIAGAKRRLREDGTTEVVRDLRDMIAVAVDSVRILGSWDDAPAAHISS